MADPIEFLFDSFSPYAYVATHRIEELGDKHDREVIWRSFLLGAMFQVNGHDH
ncbi:MAG TPA: hypothetical protein QF359_09560 [Rhodospirillales bacterium]|nr:hypothetical protein [Rhodospirillales bacterium]